MMMNAKQHVEGQGTDTSDVEPTVGTAMEPYSDGEVRPPLDPDLLAH